MGTSLWNSSRFSVPGVYFVGCFAIMSWEILLHVTCGMTFLWSRSVFPLYVRLSIIFCEYAAPLPGSASSCSFDAELMSTRSAVLANPLALCAGSAMYPGIA
jgi:hypothetical protein